MLLLASGVVLGAFGAHALKGRLSPDALVAYETAVRYQISLALAAGLIAVLNDRLGSLSWAFYLLVIGIVLFSGSIYALSSLPSPSGLRTVLGPITPLGGTLMVIAFCLAIFKLVKT